MKIKNVIYIFLMVIFILLSYLLFERGINARTKIYINYKDNGDVTYKVHLINDDKYVGMNQRYTTSLVDNIIFNLNFKSVFSESVNGYYKYNTDCILYAYTDDINDPLFQKKYILVNDMVNPLNENGNIINVSQDINIDYLKYEEELKKIRDEYKMDVNGYLELRLNVMESLNFRGIESIKDSAKQVKAIIPLSYESFKINIINNNTVNSYYDFSKKQSVNYFLMVLGAFSLALGISFLILVIKNMIMTYKNENKYNRKLKEIFDSYGDIIVKVKKFYNKKKYNLIYVTDFKELMDVYDKVNNPISFREIKKNSKSIFLLIDNDNAWIYQMDKEKIDKF